jgi:hypothetical protein
MPELRFPAIAKTAFSNARALFSNAKTAFSNARTPFSINKIIIGLCYLFFHVFLDYFSPSCWIKTS